MRPPGLRSQPSPRFLRCSSRMPPWPCTIGFGSPVVPDEKSTYSGWSNGTGSNASSPAADGSSVSTCSSVGRPARIASSSALAVDPLPAVRVAVDGQQHLRLDLGEAVDHAARPELGRDAGPDRAQAGRGQEGDQRLGAVGQVGDDAVALLHAQRLQARAHACDLFSQFAEAELAPPARPPRTRRSRAACARRS